MADPVGSMVGSSMPSTSLAWNLLFAGCLTTGGYVTSDTSPFLYVALGASDAAGAGTSSLDRAYPELIRVALAEYVGTVNLLNLGIGGARVADIQEQVRKMRAMAIRPHLVTLWTGANDLVHGDDPGSFQTTLRVTLRMLRAQHIAHLTIANLPDLTRLPAFRSRPSPVVTRARLEAFNRAIQSEARAIGAVVVDLSTDPIPDDLVFHDGFHPSEAGHRELADRFLRAIWPSLIEPSRLDTPRRQSQPDTRPTAALPGGRL